MRLFGEVYGGREEDGILYFKMGIGDETEGL